jgi:hypothetical protein
LIPRSTFLEIAKANDIIDANYDDIAGQDEINQDDLIMGGLDAMAMENVVKAEVNKPTPIVEDDEEQEDE